MTGTKRVVNRTLIYALLAAAIGAAYVYGVANIDARFGLDSDWLAPPQVAAAGLVAVVFHPVRGGLEALADRIAYGRRLRPAEAVARIAALGGATTVAAASLRDLARIVATGLGTGSAAVRLRLSDGSAVVYAWPESAEVAWAAGAVSLPVSYRGEVVGWSRVPGSCCTTPGSTSSSNISWSRPGGGRPRSGPRGGGSWPRRTASGASSNVTCTTAPSPV
jgi:hypothetical protein